MPDYQTVDINGLEIFASGSWNGDVYHDSDLDAMVSAFGKVGFKPTGKLGHADGQDDEETARKVFGAPAIGYVNKIYRNGKKLMGDFTKVPRKVADLIKAGAYNRVSAEVFWNYRDESTNKTYPRVLKSVAFLGADVPAITSLKEIEALYEKKADDAQEVRVYSMEKDKDIASYKETGTFTIKKEGDEFCVYSPDGEKIKSWPTLEAAQKSVEGYNSKVDGGEEKKEEEDTVPAGKPKPPPFMAKGKEPEKKPTYSRGGHQMTKEEMDQELKEQLEKVKQEVKAELEKEYEYRVHKAREDGKAEVEKLNDNLREEIRKLYSEKRAERDENWIKRMKADGKISPAEEPKVRALRSWIPDDDTQLKVFSLKEGKTVESNMSPAELFESLFEKRESAFKVYSKGEQADEDPGNELPDAGAEVDRRAKKYMEQQGAKGTKVAYGEALAYVLRSDKALAHKYSSGQH